MRRTGGGGGGRYVTPGLSGKENGASRRTAKERRWDAQTNGVRVFFLYTLCCRLTDARRG